MVKYILGIVVLLSVGGYYTYSQQVKSFDDSAAIKKYVKTRGTSALPRSWVGKIGEGI